MTTTAADENSGNESNKNDNNATSTSSTHLIMESIMRISLAGFGGALVGLSLSRQKQQHSRRPMRVDSTLPINWAFACAGFCSLIELSRHASLTSLVTSSRPMQTIGDFILGGAAAGAAFRGMQVGAQMAGPRTLKPNILSGMASGIALGLIAGIVQCAADAGEEMVQEERLQRLQSYKDVPQQTANDAEASSSQANEKS